MIKDIVHSFKLYVDFNTSFRDTFSKLPNKINNGDNGDVADGSYYLYGDDIQLIKNMKGVSAYRFSISWSRILPNGYGVSKYFC